MTTIPSRHHILCALSVAAVIFASGATNVLARDTDIYFTDPSASGLKPNVMLVIDTSGSMNEEIPNQALCPGAAIMSDCLTQLQSMISSGSTWPAICNGAPDQASCDYSTHTSRVDQMKQAMKTVIDESTNINMGVMRFSRSLGAAVLYPVKDLDAPATDNGNLIVAMQHSDDDAVESGGTVNLRSTTLNFASTNTVGLRFRNFYVPRGATITSAKLVFIASGSDSSAAAFSISADASDDAPPYSAVANNISDTTTRPQTIAVPWAASNWSGGARRTSVDLTSVVSAVVGRSGWCSGNAIAFKVTATAGTRQAYAYDRYDGAGFEGVGPKLVVNYTPPAPGTSASCNKTVVSRVSLGSDDAAERVSNGNMTTAQSTTNPLTLTQNGSNDQLVGVRFQNMQVPQGATIVSASIEFRIRTQNSTNASLTIQGQLSNQAATFSGNNFDISNTTNRPRTPTSVSWSSLPNPPVGSALVTPDLKDIVHDIVNQSSWASGNSMAFFFRSSGGLSGPRIVEAFETAPGKAPFLRITYLATTSTTHLVRDELKSVIVAMSTGGTTPIVDSLYEAALYMRGNAADYGRVRELGTSGTNTRLLRVDNQLSYSGGTLSQPFGCARTDLEDPACAGEQITGTPVYISPVTAGCQSNHIVLLTDGEANVNNSVTKIKTMTGASTCSGSGAEQCGVTLVSFLATKDQFPFAGTQVIHTHTVGLNTNNQFLADLASNGGGVNATANNADDLVSVFQDIINQVLSDPTAFVSPSLTVNAFNRLYNQNDVYFSLFRPDKAVAWAGNVKKYRLCDTGESCTFGEVMDASASPGIPAIDPSTSKIKTTAMSFWSTAVDGPTVNQPAPDSPSNPTSNPYAGGAGSQIPTYASTRRVYTYTGAADVGPVNLATTTSDSVNQAAVGPADNPSLTKTMLGNASMSDTDYYNIIRWMRGQDIQDDNNNGSNTDNRWKFADALHSRPVTVTYGGTSASPITKMFVGTNDGGLRMINTATGQEEWIVYLPEFLPNMKTLMDNNNGEHVIGLDGAPTVMVVDSNNNGVIEPGGSNNDKVYLFAGMRRGGRNLYAFDITPDSGPVSSATAIGEIQPKFLWRIKGGVAGDFAGLGQTWSQPRVATILVKCTPGDSTCDDGNPATADSKKKTVLIFAGGYDPGQDNAMPPGADAMGNGIYIVDPLNGSLIWRAGGTGSGAPLVIPAMKYAIASDIAVLDSNSDGAIDRLYVGDTRGQIFRIDLGDQIDPTAATAALKNGGSSGYVFADIGCTGGIRSNDCSATDKFNRRKFFYPPAIVQSRDTTYSATADYDLIAIQSGDREDPLDKITQGLNVDPVHNRVYGFRDYNFHFGAPATVPTALTDSSLYDSTSNVLQDPTGTGYAAALSSIRAANGWFFDLSDSDGTWHGEKGLAEVTVFAGVAYATTYRPPGTVVAAPGTCPPPAEGTARLYGVNYLSGAGVVDLNNNGTIDRFVDIGGGIPSDVVVVIRQGGTSALIGTSGGASVGSANPVAGSKQWKFSGGLNRFPTFWYDD